MISGFDNAGLPAERPAAGEPPPIPDEQPATPDKAPQTDAAGPLFSALTEQVAQLAVAAERYHARAEHREGVIDHLHAEVEMLRRGERRGLLRPLLVEMCRLRNDLLRQADDLPGDFDADRARLLLRSYADSVELALEDGGVATFAPEQGDQFQPRMHRRVGGQPTSDPDLTGCVARVRRTGYLDIDSNAPIAPAEVVLFVAADGSDPGVRAPDEHGSAPATGERNEP
jgi:molecular chaperone GrpE